MMFLMHGAHYQAIEASTATAVRGIRTMLMDAMMCDALPDAHDCAPSQCSAGH